MQCLCEVLVPLFISVPYLGETTAYIVNNNATGKTTKLSSISTTTQDGLGNIATNTLLSELGD